MRWFEPILIVIAVVLVISPIIAHFIKKKNGTLKCECGHLQSQCTGQCDTCSSKTTVRSKKGVTLTYEVGIEGMRCGACEAHINDVIRRNFDVTKVKSSKRKKTLVISTRRLLSIPKVKEVISHEGYGISYIKLLE